jgi:heavy metal sensor kinase
VINLRSIGVRLTLWYAAAFAVVLTALGAGTWFAVRQSLYHAIDEALEDRVEGIARFIEDHKTRLDQEEVKEEFLAHGDLFQVLDEHGAFVHQSEGLRGAVVPPTDGAAGEPRFGDGVVHGSAVRFLSRDIALGEHRYTVQVAAPLADLEEGLNDALAVLLPAFPLALALACAAGYWVSRRALAPVDDITRAAQSMTVNNLSQRLAVPPSGDELARLSGTLNDMIGRLESSFQRVSRFTADASHELRTPLAVMRTTAEVALRGDAASGEHAAALERIVAEIERTSQLVENLLTIAKADSGAAELRRKPVDVTAAVAEACAQASVLARVKGVALSTSLPQASIWTSGDSHALRRLFLILLDNAVKYTPSGGRCEVSVAASGDEVVGTVTDTGIGISKDDLPFLFDRFYRVDKARSRELGGAGLGLAIGRWIAEAHGGTIVVDSVLDRGSSFRVHLPRASAELR